VRGGFSRSLESGIDKYHANALGWDESGGFCPGDARENRSYWMTFSCPECTYVSLEPDWLLHLQTVHGQFLGWAIPWSAFEEDDDEGEYEGSLEEDDDEGEYEGSQ